MGRAAKNMHRQILNTGKKDVHRTMPEHKTKAVTNNVPQPKNNKNKAPVMYANSPNC